MYRVRGGSRLLSLRTSALVAAIALGLDRVHWILNRISFWTHTPGHQWHGAVYLPLDLIYVAPLPLLLFLLSRSGAPIMLSSPHRRLAFVIALAKAALVADSVRNWIRFLSYDWEQIHRSKAATIWLKTFDWLQTSGTPGRQFWLLVLFASSVTLLFFMIALLLHANEPRESEWRRVYWLREMAALTTIIGVVEFISRAASFGYAAASGRQDWSLSAFAINSLSNACWMFTAWIIYRSVPSSPAAATTE